jgi:hypothetical protein
LKVLGQIGSVLLMSLAFVGCQDDKPIEDFEFYDAAIAERHVLKNLQTAYEYRNVEQYSVLLADDFRFYFESETREREQLPEFWNRFTDSVQTRNLLHSFDLTDLKVKLTFDGTPRSVPGKPGWTNIDVVDTFLEIELGSNDDFPDGVTLLLDGQVNRFYFRKGRTETDTLATSPTSSLYHVVEWRDLGSPSGALSGKAGPTVTPWTWSHIKTLFKK